MKTVILHIMGTKANGEILEILAIDPDPSEMEPSDYVVGGDTIEDYQVIELYGEWDYKPSGTIFEREA